MSLTSHSQTAADSPYSRRYATRYQPTKRDACLAWHDEKFLLGPESDRTPNKTVETAMRHFALLVDISHAGALIALDEIPAREESLWLRLGTEETAEWTEAKIVGITITSRGPHLLRLEFQTPCPFEALRATICP